jgi:hypothetical protein
MSGVATDNTTVNNVIFKTAVKYVLSLYDTIIHPDAHIRCLAHVINLVVQAILAELKEADQCIEDGDDSDYFLLNKNPLVHYSIDDDTDQQDLEGLCESNLEAEQEDPEVDDILQGIAEEEACAAQNESALARVHFHLISNPAID